MLPVGDDSGLAICYELQDDGALVRKWTAAGWYAFSVLLGSDGRTLVRIGGTGEKWEKYPDDVLLLAFYYDGVLRREYRVTDIERLLGRSLRESEPSPEYRGDSFEGELVGRFIGLSPMERMKWRFHDGSIIEFVLTGDVASVNAATKETTKEPNHALEPTPTAGTSAAEQPLVPAAVVAHL